MSATGIFFSIPSVSPTVYSSRSRALTTSEHCSFNRPFSDFSVLLFHLFRRYPSSLGTFKRSELIVFRFPGKIRCPRPSSHLLIPNSIRPSVTEQLFKTLHETPTRIGDGAFFFIRTIAILSSSQQKEAAHA